MRQKFASQVRLEDGSKNDHIAKLCVQSSKDVGNNESAFPLADEVFVFWRSLLIGIHAVKSDCTFDCAFDTDVRSLGDLVVLFSLVV